MANGLDELEQHLNRKKRNAPASRNARSRADEAAAAAAKEAEERERARAARAAREAEAAAAAASQADRPSEPQPPQPAPAPVARESVPTPAPAAKRARPKATPVYLDPDLEDWLWEIKKAAASLQVDVSVSAVARRALRDLSQRKTAAQIVAELSSTPDPNEGKRGRPRR